LSLSTTTANAASSFSSTNQHTTTNDMSAHDNEELIDYEDEDVGTTTIATAAGSNGVAVAGGTAGEKDKKNFSGIHSTGFRQVFYAHKCTERHGLRLCIGTSC
jgi:hypothetical protein